MSDLFLLPDPACRERLLQSLADAGPYTIGEVGTRTESRRYLDSFDWRLFRAGMALALADDTLRLERLADAGLMAAAPVVDSGIPCFASELPAGPLRDEVGRRLRIRALVRRVSVSVDIRIREVRDTEGRIALRLEETLWRPERARQPSTLTTLGLRPVKGFADVRERARATCFHTDLALVSIAPAAWAFRAAGLEPGGYEAKPRIVLGENLDAREAVRRVCRQLLATMLENEEGLRADWDTEFLHDFRVAIRRTRSLLGQAKAVFPASDLDVFRRDFRTLGRLTGPLRDLDVHLLDEGRYRDLLPNALQPGLDSLFARLRLQRLRARDALVDALDDGIYRDLVRRWTVFLAPRPGQDLSPTSAGAKPVRTFACRRIRRQHRRILNRGARIDASTPPATLHRMRIECKKLRYLLELFADLFPRREIRTLVAQLKKLQDHLGEGNDLRVQQQRLREDLATLPPDGPAALAEAAAIGGLLAVLAQRQNAVREAYAESFAYFAQESISRRFARLCEQDERA